MGDSSTAKRAMEMLEFVGRFPAMWRAPTESSRKLLGWIGDYNSRRRSKDLEIEADSGQCLWFAFLGEFGFGITSWIPWVKYLRETSPISIATIGVEGTSFLYGFSDRHIEVGLKNAGHSWGSERDYRALSEQFKIELIHPANERVRRISVCGATWENSIYDRTLRSNYYRQLQCDGTSPEYEKLRREIGHYVVINNKHYLNWNGADIPNYYNLDEISRICRFAAKRGLRVLLNVFEDPVVDEKHNTYFSMSYSDLNEPNLINLASTYARIPDKGDQNRFQAAILSGARGVFATQGGNAQLSIVCNKNVSVLFRGGFDHPSLVGLSKVYGCNLNIFNAIEHVLQDRPVSVTG